MTSKQFEQALELASLNLPVFACHMGAKTPATPHGCQDATTDEAELFKMFAQGEGLHNIGLAAGELTGQHSQPAGTYKRVIIFDDDSAKAGAESFIDIAAREHGIEIQETCHYITGGGGHSYMFADPKGLISTGGANNKLHFDVRADGQYSIVPNSYLDNGKTYEWVIKPSELIAEVGEAELALYELWKASRPNKCTTKHKSGSERISSTFKIENNSIHSGERNDTLFRLTAGLIANGLSEECIYTIVGMVNDIYCDEPVSDRELSHIIDSAIGRYEPGDSKWLRENHPHYCLTVIISYLLNKGFGLDPSILYNGAMALNESLDNKLSDDAFNAFFNKQMKKIHRSAWCV